jgi:hypothetical protein
MQTWSAIKFINIEADNSKFHSSVARLARSRATVSRVLSLMEGWTDIQPEL